MQLQKPLTNFHRLPIKSIFFIGLGMLIFLAGACKPNNEPESFSASFTRDSLRLIELCEQYRKTAEQNYNESKVPLKHILDTINSLPENKKTLSIPAYYLIALQEIRSGNFQYADSISKRCFKVADSINDINYLDLAYNSRGIYYWVSGNLDSAKIFMKKAILYSDSTNHIEKLIAAKINYATMSKNGNNNDEQISQFLELIDLCEKNGKWRLMADACNNLANIYNQKGMLFTAMKYYLKAIELYKESGSEAKLLIPYNNIALIYLDLGMDSLATKYFDEIISNSLKANNILQYSNATLNKISISHQNGNYNKTIRLTNELLSFLKTNKYPITRNYALCYNTLGEVYLKLKDYNMSYKYLNKAMHLSDSLELEAESIDIANSMAKYYYNTHNYDKLIVHAKKTFEAATNMQHFNGQINLSKYLAEIHGKKKNYEEALKYYDIYTDLSQHQIDTLSSQKAKDFAYYNELQVKETERQSLQKENMLSTIEKQNQELTINNQRLLILVGILAMIAALIFFTVFILQFRKRGRLNAQLSEENDFKSNLFSIVSHDLRSPITSLHDALILLNTQEFDEKTRTKIEQSLLTQTEKTIDLIDNLLFWTRKQLKESETLNETFNPKHLVDKIVAEELGYGKTDNINFENNIPESLEIFTDINIVHLVFRNILSNAYKFTPKEGTIKVGYKLDADKITFHVTDTGIGIAENNKLNIINSRESVSMKGLNGEKGIGFGLVLSKFFLQKCKGELWFESKVSLGTTFYFSVPLS